MKCHYEVLDVSRDAELPEIKSAYRKAALKWHPDKNLTDTENAKEQFQLVQQAYEVLSDPQERAWYDKHREQILRGANTEFQDNSLDVFPYFTTTCFRGYGDDENGFFSVYRKVFDLIIQEDVEFMDDKEEFVEIPKFGNSQSDYDEVVGPFYAYWSSYSTKKSYVWLDPHNIKEIRERKIFKIVEKENKKVRLKAKKERNEEVRNLVAFVRKRDKRVQEHSKLLEAKILENRQKQEVLSKQRRMERKKQLNESGTQAEWTKFDNVQSELEEIEKHLAQEFGEELSNSEEEIEEINDLYCVACNKFFKTDKALKNHESSKKHKENVDRLTDIMLEEEEEECGDVAEDKLGDNSQIEDLTEEESEDSIEKTKKQKKKNKKAKNILRVNHEEEHNGDVDVTQIVNSDDDFGFEQSKKQKKKNKKQKNNAVAEDKVEKNDTSTSATEAIGKNVMEANGKSGTGANGKSETEANGKNVKEANGKNVKEANRKSVTETNGRSSKKQKKDKEKRSEEIDTSHCCVSCMSSFQSKNKLFEHLKKTGHGVYIPKGKNVK